MNFEEIKRSEGRLLAEASDFSMSPERKEFNFNDENREARVFARDEHRQLSAPDSGKWRKIGGVDAEVRRGGFKYFAVAIGIGAIGLGIIAFPFTPVPWLIVGKLFALSGGVALFGGLLARFGIALKSVPRGASNRARSKLKFW